MSKYANVAWGVGIGIIGTLLVGFTWGGWSTDSTVKQKVETAQNQVLTRVCADRMLSDPTAVALLDTKKPNDYDDAVRDMRKTWKTVGYEYPDYYGFNRECGKVIESLKLKTAAK